MPEPVEMTQPVLKVPVIQLSNRTTELLRVPGSRSGYEEQFILRDTQYKFGDSKATVFDVWLRKSELRTLGERIEEMLTDGHRIVAPIVAPVAEEEAEPERSNGKAIAVGVAGRYPSRCDIPGSPGFLADLQQEQRRAPRVGVNGTLRSGKL